MSRLRSPLTVLVIGWLVFMLYAYPGYLSQDSVDQLLEARAGAFGGRHPPLMGAIWAVSDFVISGPLGMLLLQSVSFVAGVFLIARRWTSEWAAAWCAAGVLLFPPVCAVLAVIWKDSQMIGYLALGAGLLPSPRRRIRLFALAVLGVATAMRYNAVAITLPLIAFGFVWCAEQRRLARYAIAIAAWLAITVLVGVVNRVLVRADAEPHLWHESLALLDLTGTIRHAPVLTDDELLDDLRGTPLRVPRQIQASAASDHRADDLSPERLASFGAGHLVPALWSTTFHLFEVPVSAAQRDAIARAWKHIVLAHPMAYLAYRWDVFREVLHLDDDGSQGNAYVWFTSGRDRITSARQVEHAAVPSRIQRPWQSMMLWLGTTPLFHPWIYLLVSLPLLLVVRRQSELCFLVISGIANEAALFVLAPTTDFRYSIWLVVTTVFVGVIWIVRRMSTRQLPRDALERDVSADLRSSRT